MIRNLRELFSIFLFAIFLCFSIAPQAVAEVEWSDTTPKLNLTHIFHGEINRHGKPVGLHVAPNESAASKRRLQKILSGPNRTGVYTANVQIFDTAQQKWKTKFSSLFPDYMTRQQIIGSILNAISHNFLGSGAKWRGPSGHGFFIEGYIRNDRVNTAYPIYARD